MTDSFTVTTERVDDIPVLLAQQERMGVPAMLDRHFPPHGNRQGISLGALAMPWLTHVLSEADHQMSHVRSWARQRLASLQQHSGQAVKELDFTDDRLADVLTALSDDGRWQAFERALNQNLLRVYDLSAEWVRLDSMTASGYWTVSEDGLVQLPADVLATYLSPVWTGEQTLTAFWRPRESDSPEQIAEGFELTQTLTAAVNGKLISWTER